MPLLFQKGNTQLERSSIDSYPPQLNVSNNIFWIWDVIADFHIPSNSTEFQAADIMDPAKKKSYKHNWAGIGAIVLSVLACEPVIAIGKNELLCLLVLIIVLLGPPLYRLARRVEEFLTSQKRDKE